VAEDLFDEPERRAQEKVEAARVLLARGRLREALDALNVAIQLWPSNPGAFLLRAEVFERMRLVPQAEADRRRAGALAAAPGPARAEPAAAPAEAGEGEQAGKPAQGAAEVAAAQGEPAAARPGFRVAEPGSIPRETGTGPGVGVGLFVALVAMIFLVGIAGGIVIAAAAVDWGSLDPFRGGGTGAPTGTPRATGVAGGSGTPAPSAEPTEPADVSTSGDPYSLSDLRRAWEAKGMTVEMGGGSSGFAGFKTAPVEVTLRRGGASSALSVFVYKTREAALAEWELAPGSRPAAKGSKTIPAYVSAWWNANVVVILRTDPGGLGPDALDGLLNLGG